MVKRLNLKITYLLVVLYSLYDVFNSASAGNSTANRSGVYVFLFAVVAFLALFCLSNRFLPKFGLLILLTLFVVYYLLDMCFIKGETGWSIVVYFGLSVWWVLTVCFFYNNISHDIYSFVSIQNFMRIMYILFSAAVLYGAINIATNYSVDYARVGYIYHILAMIPFVLLERNEKIKNVFIIIAIVLTVFSFKRGAIIIFPCMLLAYFIFDNNTKQRKSNIFRMFLLIAAIVVVWLIINKYSGGYLSSRFTRVELMDGSGRSEVWGVALSNVSHRNVYQLLFGIAGSEEQALWTGIHNEWIAFLYNNGIIGLVLFASIILSIISQGIRLVKSHSRLAASYMALVVYILGVCMVSGFYHVHSTFYVMLYLGTAQGLLTYEDDVITKLLERR